MEVDNTWLKKGSNVSGAASGDNGYLSLFWISSTGPPWLHGFFGVFTASCSPSSAVCRGVSALPLYWLSRWDASSALALAGHGGGLSARSCCLLPLACLFTPGAPLPPPWMVVLLRRLAGPLISALSLMSAAPTTQKIIIGFFFLFVCFKWQKNSPAIYFSTCHTFLVARCSWPELYRKSGGLPSFPAATVFVTIRRFITTTQGASDSTGLPGLCFIFISPDRVNFRINGFVVSICSGAEIESHAIISDSTKGVIFFFRFLSPHHSKINA